MRALILLAFAAVALAQPIPQQPVTCTGTPATCTFPAGSSVKVGNTLLPLWFDVTSPNFGAKCDGSTNDRTAFAAAITAATAVNGRVWVPATTAGCNVGSQITLPINVRMEGVGEYLSKINCTATSGACIAIGSTESGNAIKGGGLSNLTVSGSGSGNSTIGVFLGGDPASVITPAGYQADNLKFESVLMTNFGVGWETGNLSYIIDWISTHTVENNYGFYTPCCTISGGAGEHFHIVGGVITGGSIGIYSLGGTSGLANPNGENVEWDLDGVSLDYVNGPLLSGSRLVAHVVNSHLENNFNAHLVNMFQGAGDTCKSYVSISSTEIIIDPNGSGGITNAPIYSNCSFASLTLGQGNDWFISTVDSGIAELVNWNSQWFGPGVNYLSIAHQNGFEASLGTLTPPYTNAPLNPWSWNGGFATATTSVNESFAQLFCFGDLYMSGFGATLPSIQGICPLIDKAIPNQPPLIDLVTGAAPTADSIAYNVLSYFSPLPSQPSISIIDAGNNDAACGTSTACQVNFKEEMMAMEAWLTIPYPQRQMASTATKTGTWSTDTSFPSINPGVNATAYISSPGTPIAATSSGATLTFSVPSSASPIIGVTFQVTNLQTGTFTVSIDGSLQTDQCSTTTTFTSAPCGSLTMPNTTTSVFRQEFSVTPNTTHTVVVTTTNTAKVDVACVDWVPYSLSAINENTLYVIGPNAFYTNYATYESASKAVAAQLLSDGLPVYYVSMVAGTPGVNSTTDLATSTTSTCDASTSSGFPNGQCGYMHLAQTLYNVELANSTMFSTLPTGPNLSAVGGVPNISYPTVDIGFRQSAISSAALFTAPHAGFYRVTYDVALSTVATVSSILGGTTGFSVTYQDGTDFVTRTVTLEEINQSGTPLTISSGNTTNTTAATIHGSQSVYISAGNIVTYSLGYSSTGATAMQYQIHIRVEAM